MPCDALTLRLGEYASKSGTKVADDEVCCGVWCGVVPQLPVKVIGGKVADVRRAS
jgi:hypothetical protein